MVTQETFKILKNRGVKPRQGFGDGIYGESLYLSKLPKKNVMPGGEVLQWKAEHEFLFIPLRMPIGDLPWDGGIWEDFS
jgi:hypothetical protein